MPKKEFLASPQSGLNQRLDVFLAGKMYELARSRLQKIIEEKGVRVNGAARKSSYRLKAGDRVEIEYELELEEPEEIQAEKIPLNILYSDSQIAVIDKPSGMVVHPGAGAWRHTLVNALLYYFPEMKGVGHAERPGIVHRLDKETSGLMAVARTQEACSELQRQFRKREVGKLYLGLVWGKFPEIKGKISLPIGRHIKHGERISVRTNRPRDAETHYSVEKEYGEFTFLKIRPVTGRTHQIRVHMAATGHPVVGDRRYGRRKTKVRCPRLFLHASRLSFQHPETRQRVEFSSPLPQELRDFLDKIAKDSLK